MDWELYQIINHVFSKISGVYLPNIRIMYNMYKHKKSNSQPEPQKSHQICESDPIILIWICCKSSFWSTGKAVSLVNLSRNKSRILKKVKIDDVSVLYWTS